MRKSFYDRRQFLRTVGLGIAAGAVSRESTLEIAAAREEKGMHAAKRPNVILINTDDQGYGDIQSHGNPVIKTPAIDKLREQSVRFTDFHAAPMCSPTRGQLMTGMDAMKNGATAVCQGRSMIRREIKIMPEFFRDAGYTTGIFGKWHLGDSYPYRPEDRGFDEVLTFHAWGITSLADYWQNNYFDPRLKRNGGDYKKYEGYCTDIFFNEAMKWIDKQHQAGKPFFVYIPTNTPHVPDIVAKRYSDPYRGEYKGKKIPADFYGMIANIDENIGKLENFLKEKELRDNTVLIFMTDNGTQSKQAMEIYNAGMREQKTSLYEGGHRVPLFIRWNEGELIHGKDVSELTQAQDILPTLIELCNLKAGKAAFNGVSLDGLLKGTQEKLEDRMIISQYGVGGNKGDAVVMWKKWRLLHRHKLFDISKDPHQDTDVSREFPNEAEVMNAYYDKWYQEAKPLFDRPRYITIGSDEANPMMLYSNDWVGDYCDNMKGLITATGTGYWDIVVEKGGTYEFEMRRWPEESGKPLVSGFGSGETLKRSARPIAKAQLIIADQDKQIDTKVEDTAAVFTIELQAGITNLIGNFMDKDGNILCGAVFMKVRRL